MGFRVLGCCEAPTPFRALGVHPIGDEFLLLILGL